MRYVTITTASCTEGDVVHYPNNSKSHIRTLTIASPTEGGVVNYLNNSKSHRRGSGKLP